MELYAGFIPCNTCRIQAAFDRRFPRSDLHAHDLPAARHNVRKIRNRYMDLASKRFRTCRKQDRYDNNHRRKFPVVCSVLRTVRRLNGKSPGTVRNTALQRRASCLKLILCHHRNHNRFARCRHYHMDNENTRSAASFSRRRSCYRWLYISSDGRHLELSA